MKKNIFFFLFFVPIFFAASAQIPKESQPVYLKNPTIPSFKVYTTDSILFTKENLPKGKPIILIYFSPDCAHCQNEAQEIKKNMNIFKNAFFLWVSFRPLHEIKNFGKKYKLSKYKNVQFVNDPKYFLPSFYKVEFTPFIAVYNVHGFFTKEFRHGTTPIELAAAIK